MSTQSHYDQWSAQYDTNENKTRDLEGECLRVMLNTVPFQHVLEIGAGTGKNTVWLQQRAQKVVAVDLSEEMLAVARAKLSLVSHSSCTVEFIQADITQPWTFGVGQYDLVGFSLMLEHIADLPPVFAQAAQALKPGGHVYLGELHPFKQYLGSKAKYLDAAGEEVIVECFNHHISDFLQAAGESGLTVVDLQEWFDGGDRGGVPRVLGMLFRKG